jgi:DNA-binding CsgD family transcriptional regulator
MSSRRTRQRRAETRLQQICCLGLKQQVAIPLVLRELHELVPSHWNGFFWCGADGNVDNLFLESPMAMELVPFYYQEFYNNRELEVFRGWQYAGRHLIRSTRFDALLRVDRRRFLRHAFYAEVLGPLEFDNAVFTAVRARGRPLGFLLVVRTRGDPPFAAADLRHLDRLSAFIAHALMHAGEQRQDDWLDAPGDEGLIIANRRGGIEWMTPSARSMLILASCDRLSRNVRTLPCLHRLGTPLLRLLRRIETLERGGPAAAPPAWTRNNAWGRFRFHAHRLDPTTGPEPLFGITVRPQQPLPVRILDHIDHLALPPRQAQVCLGIASGQTSSQIARQLAIAESTVISHTRAVYNRIGVRNRGELINRLLAT